MAAPSDPRRTALTLISAGMLGLALVLGLWQQVDRACVDGDADVAGALAACEAVPLAEDETLGGAPADGEMRRVSAAN